MQALALTGSDGVSYFVGALARKIGAKAQLYYQNFLFQPLKIQISMKSMKIN